MKINIETMQECQDMSLNDAAKKYSCTLNCIMDPKNEFCSTMTSYKECQHDSQRPICKQFQADAMISQEQPIQQTTQQTTQQNTQ